MNFVIDTPLTVTYTVDKCVWPSLNGTHTEEFDLSTLTSEDITQYIAQTLIIKRQGLMRAKTSEKLVPGKWAVPSPGKRISTSPTKKMEDLMGKLTAEQLKAFRDMILAKLDNEV